MKAEVLTNLDSHEEVVHLKSVPCNIDAEKAVLGAILNNNENLNKVGDFLLAQHFYVPIHRKIFEAIIHSIERGRVATPITLKNYFEKEEELKQTGINSLDYLLKLCSSAASVMNIVPFAKHIYDTSLRRNLIAIGEETVTEAHEWQVTNTPQHLIEKAEQKLFNLASQGLSDGGFEGLSTSLNEAIRRIEIARKLGNEVNGIATGYVELDQFLGGMQNSDLLILAARPSMGKTSLAINIALNSAIEFIKANNKEEKTKSVGIFSLEMSSEQIANRLLSIQTNIDGNKIRIGNVSKEDFLNLLKESDTLNQLPIFIDDTPALSIAAVRTRARRLKRQHNLGLIVVDYLQLLRGVNAGEGNRVQEIGEISQGLKAIAKELDIPVLALSQLSRAVETREDKRPQLSDLRESGNIEQDADVVMFIYREEYYLARKMPQEGSEDHLKWQDKMEAAKSIADIIIAKQRNGPVGNLSLRFNSNTTGFDNLDKKSTTFIPG